MIFEGLASHGVRTLKVSPALDDPAVGNPPNHNSGEFEALIGGRIGARPMVANYNFVVLGDEVFDGYLQVGNFLEGGADVLDSPRRSRRKSRGDVGAVIHKAGREIHVTDAQVFPVYEFLKMIAD